MLSLISIGFNMLIAASILALAPHAAALARAVVAVERSDAPKIVTLDAPTDVHDPQAAVDASGHVFVVYASKSLVSISISPDGARTFGPSIAVGRIGTVSVGMRRGPRVALTPRALVVSAIGGVQGGGRDGDLVAWRSTNGGTSWLAPAKLNDVPGSAREGLHAMAAGPSGELACAWLDVRSGKMELYSATSSDDGVSWSPNRLVYHSPDGSICECCHPSLAFDARGTLYVMFRNELGGARDMYIVESRDTGKTFGRSRKLGTGTWKVAACPMDGGAFAIDGTGKVASIWRREQEIFFAEAGAEEHKVHAGEQPWIASGPKGFFSVWLERRGGDLWLLAPQADAPRMIASDANDPMIACALDGKGSVVAVWETTAHYKSSLCVARVDQAASASGPKDK
jgi:hypothetical protein